MSTEYGKLGFWNKGPASPQTTKVIHLPLLVNKSFKDPQRSPYPSDSIGQSVFGDELLFLIKGTQEVFSVFNNIYIPQMVADNLNPSQKRDMLREQIRFIGLANATTEARATLKDAEGRTAIRLDGFVSITNEDNVTWKVGDFLTYELPDVNSKNKRHLAKFKLVPNVVFFDEIESWRDVPEALRAKWQSNVTNIQTSGPELINDTINFFREKFKYPIVAKVTQHIPQGKSGQIQLLSQF